MYLSLCPKSADWGVSNCFHSEDAKAKPGGCGGAVVGVWGGGRQVFFAFFVDLMS